MYEVSHILVLSQPKFVERQVGEALADHSGSSPLRSRIGAWFGWTAGRLQ